MKTRSTATAAFLSMALMGWAAGAAAQTATPPDEPRSPKVREPHSQTEEAKRVHEAADVFADIMKAPDSAIPQNLLDKAEAVAVFPNVIKAAFVVGGQYGNGVMSVRNRETGTWSPPAFLKLAGGSWGAQIGGESADIVLLVMNRRGVDKLLQSQFKVGGEAEASAGPVGRRAEASTDIQMRAEILSYSRSRGLFAGISLSGASIHEDINDNEDFYGQRLHTREIVLAAAPPKPSAPQAVAAWRNTLNQYSVAATSGRKDDK
jgi:SH3 domain-containing YSC84-like protein 1